MSKFIAAILLQLALNVNTLNPGFVVKVHKNKIPQIMKVAVPIMNPLLKNVVLNETIDVSLLKLTSSVLDIANLLPSQIDCPFNNDPNFIQCEISKAAFNIISQAEIDTPLFKSTGTIKCQGVLNLIRVRFGFKEFTEKQKGKPFLNLVLEDLHFDKDSMQIHIDMKGIPNALIDQIVKTFKSSVLNKIKENLIKFVKEKGNLKINQIIDEKYPSAVDLVDIGISMRTELNACSIIDQENIIFGMDATFYDTKTGYKRTKESHLIDSKPMDKYFLDIALTSYMINSFFESIYDKRIKVTTEKAVFEVQSTWKSPDLVIDSEAVKCNAFTGALKLYKENMFAEFIGDVSFDLHLNSRKSIDQFVDFDFKKLSLNEMKFNSNIPVVKYMEFFVKYALKSLFVFLHSFSVDIPNINFPGDIKLTDFELRMNSGFIDAGISVDIDHVVEAVQNMMNGYQKVKKSVRSWKLVETS